jgi:hypothetical protein
MYNHRAILDTEIDNRSEVKEGDKVTILVVIREDTVIEESTHYVMEKEGELMVMKKGFHLKLSEISGTNAIVKH